MSKRINPKSKVREFYKPLSDKNKRKQSSFESVNILDRLCGLYLVNCQTQPGIVVYDSAGSFPKCLTLATTVPNCSFVSNTSTRVKCAATRSCSTATQCSTATNCSTIPNCLAEPDCSTVPNCVSNKEIANNASTKCARVGVVTRNPFLNFLRQYRTTHCGLRMIEIAVEGAKCWNTMVDEEKWPYIVESYRTRKRRRLSTHNYIGKRKRKSCKLTKRRRGRLFVGSK